ncbi:DUF4446 family protein [Alicyclobacillus curvatus]|nr:DUF4446 family protein [Alicyclobacillus curvatus]
MNLPMNTTDLWLVGLTAVTLLNFILVIVLSVQKSKLRRQLKRWQGIHETADLDAIYDRTLKRVEAADEVLANLSASVHAVELALRTKVSTPKVTRYNAFSDTGSDLSFSVALVDDTQTGIVMSSIYGREESRTYGKPVVNGQSSYPLTDEEAEVLSVAPSASGRRPVKTV